MADSLESQLDQPNKVKKKSKKLFIAGSALFVVVALAAIFFFAGGVIPRGAETRESQGSTEARKGIEGHLYSMEPFLVNLAGGGNKRYLKVRMDLESTEKKPNEEYQQRLPQLRDTILTILSSKKYADVYDSEGKNKLREEILSKVNPLVMHFKVRMIYFTEFVVQ